MTSMYNLRSPAVKRLMHEAEELRNPTHDYFAEPIEDNLFEWHFTIRGPSNSDFYGGIYHGRIILPSDYPMKPPSIIMLTPNGRFEVNKKICLSISEHHPELWQPSWSIRTALLAIIGHMPTQGQGAIGSLDYTPAERIVLAVKSRDYVCPSCGPVKTLLSDDNADDDSKINEVINNTDIEENNCVPSSPGTVPSVIHQSVDDVIEALNDSDAAMNVSDTCLRRRFQQSSFEDSLLELDGLETPIEENQSEVFATICMSIIIAILCILIIRRVVLFYSQI